MMVLCCVGFRDTTHGVRGCPYWNAHQWSSQPINETPAAASAPTIHLPRVPAPSTHGTPQRQPSPHEWPPSWASSERTYLQHVATAGPGTTPHGTAAPVHGDTGGVPWWQSVVPVYLGAVHGYHVAATGQCEYAAITRPTGTGPAFYRYKTYFTVV